MSKNDATDDLKLKVGSSEHKVSGDTKLVSPDGSNSTHSVGGNSVGVSVSGDQSIPKVTVVDEQPDTPDEDCNACVYAFSSSVPGSRVYIGRGAMVDGCRFDGFVTFAPTGTPKPNPLKRDELIYPIGIFATRDKALAEKLQSPLDCGISVAYQRYIPQMDEDMMAATGIGG